jgi:SAM-dependent methyltransferase
MVVGPVTKQIVKQGSKIYDAIKSGRSKTTPVSTPVNKPVKTENEIADEAYELGKEFAERGTRSETGLWEYPEQSITSADTSINVSKLPQGYTKLIKNNTFKKGDVVLDIGGGRFDNAVDTLKEKNVTVKVYDPFNRSLEHNRAVVETVRDGQADKVVSFNTLNVIPEEANRLKVIEQAHNALKENGEAFFTVYGDPKKKAGATVKGYQAHLPLKDYVSSVKEVFGEDSVTSSGGIIKAIKTSNDIPKLNTGGTITPFGDTFNYSTTTGLNKRYLEHYHGNVLDNNLQRIDEQGQTNTMLLSTVERDGKHYILPSYDPLTKSQMKTPQDIFKLNQEAIDTGLSVGYPSKDIAEKELQKLRTTIIEDRNKLEEELELYGDFDEEGNRRTYFDPRSEEQIEAIKKRKLDEQMEKIKQRGDTSYGLATGGMISAEERDKNRNDLTQSLRFLLGQGVALGFGDEIEAYVRSKLGDKTYEENKSIIKNEMKTFEIENPLTAAGLEIAGGLTSAAGIYKTLGKAGLKQMAARGTAAGGIEGGIYGAGAPEIFGTDNRLAGSAIGTGIGAALGGVGETVVGAIANTLRKNKVANISPTSTRKDILQNIPRDEKTDNYIMYHGDSMYDIKGDARPTNKGLNVPQESFVKNNPVSLAIDVENARTYAGVLTDKTGASGFLYEVSIPKKILDNVFDPFNEKHVAIFKKRINKMLYEGKGEISTDSKNWKQVKDKDAYIQNSYTDRMQLKGPMATSNNNWDVLEQPDVVEALKKEGFTGTWQKETGLETYNQIQIFDGSSVNIITENTQKIFRDNQGTYSMASLDSFLENIDTSKQGGVNTITAKEFNQKLKEAKERGEEIIFNGKDVSDLF